MKTDTPETDAFYGPNFQTYPAANFSRKLERDRNEARARLMNIELSEIGPRVETIKQLDQAISDLNSRLIERQESFQAQLIRIDDAWRYKLREKDAQIVALREALEECGFRAEKIQSIRWGNDGDCGASFNAALIENAAAKALSTPAPAVVPLEDVRMMSDELRSIARQKLSSELEGEEAEGADFEDGYNHCVKTAREAVAAFEKLLP